MSVLREPTGFAAPLRAAAFQLCLHPYQGSSRTRLCVCFILWGCFTIKTSNTHILAELSVTVKLIWRHSAIDGRCFNETHTLRVISLPLFIIVLILVTIIFAIILIINNIIHHH